MIFHNEEWVQNGNSLTLRRCFSTENWRRRTPPATGSVRRCWGTHTLLANYRWSHSTQIGITGQMEYFRNILLHSPRIGRAQSLPKGEVLRHQLRSEDTHQQVGQCSTAMIQDGREILLNADADRAQEMRVTLVALTGCSMERHSTNKPTTSASQALGQVNYSWDGEYSQAQNDSNTRCGCD